MRRALALALGLAFIPVCLLTANNSKSKIDHPHRKLYEDTARYNQLSQGARILLEKRFGPKSKSTQNLNTPNPAPPEDVSNVLVNNPALDATEQDTQASSALVLGSGTNVISAFTDSASFTGLNNHFTGFSSSANSGDSFSDHGSLLNSTEGDGGSPVLARNAISGTIYMAALGFTTNEMIPVFRSNNDGTSFLAPVNASPGYVASGDFLDKPWVAVDNFSGAGQGNTYVVWRHFPFSGTGSIKLTRSTDGGATWGPNQGTDVLTGVLQGANIVIGPDHSLFVFAYDQTNNPRTIKMKRSTDQGATFSAAVNVVSLVGTGNNGDLGLNGGFATNSYPQAAVNSANGHVYVVYNDDPAGVDRSHVFLRRSTDSGQTWNAIQVNSDSTSNDQFFPAIAVTPDGSNLIVSWYDRRNDPANSKIERFAEIFSIDGAGTLTSVAEFPVSTSSFPPVVDQDPEVTPTYMGEYDQIAADNQFFYISWSDNRSGNVAHTNQPDVMFSRIPVNGPGVILDLVSYSVDDSTGNANGAVDQNECVLLNTTIRNSGSTTATGLTATLSTTTPEVSITQPNSAFADIAPGNTGDTITPFQIQTGSAFDCGNIDIDFVLTVDTTSDGSFQLPFTVRSGGAGLEVQFDNNTPQPIPDLGTVDIPVNVSGITDPVAQIRASIQISHTGDADLDIYLVGPDDTVVELSTDNGGSSDNYGSNCSPQTSRTTFDDDAAVSITAPAAAAPFTGTFRPEGNLAAFRGKSGSDVNGTWLLRVFDDSGIDTGTVNCVSIFVSPVVCTPGPGDCGCPPISILPADLPDGAPGVAYSQQLSAAGGVPPHTFAVTAGSLPPGFTLSGAGLLSGTTTQTGTFNFSVTATDDNGCVGTVNYELIIACPLIDLLPASLPDGVVNQPYNQTITASGGTEPYVFTIDSGALPSGLTLAFDGELTGTPTTEGLFNFAVRATDNVSCSGVRNYSLNVECASITLSPFTLQDAIIGAPYAAVIIATGGTAPYSFAVTSGTLPGGLSLDANGNLTGTPGTTGTFNFTVTATDSTGCTGSLAYTIDVVSVPCLYCDDFEDGILSTDWNYIKDSWNETGGELVGDPDRRKAIAVAFPAFGGCTNCVVETTMISSGGPGNRMWLLAWYVDKRHTMELLMKEENDKWVLKQRFGGAIVKKMSASRPIDPNVNYHVLITFDGSQFTLNVNGENILTLQPAATVSNGTVGFQTKNTTGRFLDIIVN